MRKIIGFPATWIFYYLGCFFSIFMNSKLLENAPEMVINIFYKPYNFFLTTSYHIQRWSELKNPWRKLKEDDE